MFARALRVSADPRCLAGEALAAALRDSRDRTRSLVTDLDEAAWRRTPAGSGLNPVAWELGHLAWFWEFWVLRGPHHEAASGAVSAARPARIAGPDDVFDSARLPHAARWQVALPSRRELLQRLDDQLDACLQALTQVPADDAGLYFHRLGLFHEDMHAEALAWQRQSQGLPPSASERRPEHAPAGRLQVPGGERTLGHAPGRPGFAFDNEQAGLHVVLDGFEIDAAPVTCGDLLRFVEAGGYEVAGHWQDAGGTWWLSERPRHPAHWRSTGRGWQVRWFDRWEPLDPLAPACHVNAHEAEAYCRWAGRALPSAAEWEHAAATAGAAFRWGRSVWEWTASPFQPYPGFVAGPYRDYSAPWFGDHRELRGGSFATHARLHDRRYRNFFLPHRTDLFTGFRTVSVS